MKAVIALCILGCLGIAFASAPPALPDDLDNLDNLDTDTDTDTGTGTGTDVDVAVDVGVDDDVEVTDWESYCPAAFPGLCESKTISNGSCHFRFFAHRATFRWAEHRCRHLRGHLASVHNAYTNRLLVCASTYCNHRYPVWIGAFRRGRWGRFHWTDGSCWNYSSWACGRPTHTCNSCVVMNLYGVGRWSNQNCCTANAFVCQY
ncbi:C-type lectin BPL [Amia ocellicauda]|uniref:C-type lectin BPL n=1 Tax=Amia ocellicauda TaxID=2972642 RepID=UPI0034640FD2